MESIYMILFNAIQPIFIGAPQWVLDWMPHVLILITICSIFYLVLSLIFNFLDIIK